MIGEWEVLVKDITLIIDELEEQHSANCDHKTAVEYGLGEETKNTLKRQLWGSMGSNDAE